MKFIRDFIGIQPLEFPKGLEAYFMANPIQPVGGRDIYESAQQQDEERRQREMQDHFERTGEHIPLNEYDPLVPINGYEPPDIASDGDSYNETRMPSYEGLPSRFQNRLDDLMSQSGVFEQSNKRREALAAEEKRLQAIRDKEKAELQKLIEQSKNKFRNAISGLEVEDEE